MFQGYLGGTDDVGFVDRQNFIYEAEDYLERLVNAVSPPDGAVAMQDFLEYLDIGHQTFAVGDEPFQNHLAVSLVRMRSPNKVHGHVGIDEDHCLPWSLSLSICLMSAVGYESRAACRMMASLVAALPFGLLCRAARKLCRTHSPTDKFSEVAACRMSSISCAGSNTCKRALMA